MDKWPKFDKETAKLKRIAKRESERRIRDEAVAFCLARGYRVPKKYLIPCRKELVSVLEISGFGIDDFFKSLPENERKHWKPVV